MATSTTKTMGTSSGKPSATTPNEELDKKLVEQRAADKKPVAGTSAATKKRAAKKAKETASPSDQSATQTAAEKKAAKAAKKNADNEEQAESTKDDLDRKLEQQQAEQRHEVAPEKVPSKKNPSVADRLDSIEAALSVALDLNLAEFDPQAAVNARAQAAAKVAEEMAKMVEKATADSGLELTNEQRVERIEAAMRSGGSLP